MLPDWLLRPSSHVTNALDDAPRFNIRGTFSEKVLSHYWTGEHYVPESYVNMLPIGAAGAIISSVADYALWARALIDAAAGKRDSCNCSSPVDRALYRAVTTPRSILLDVETGEKGEAVSTYGLGWRITAVGPHQVVTRSGGLPGFGTQVFLLPNEGLGVITIANTQFTGATAGKKGFLQILRRVVGEVDTADTNPNGSIYDLSVWPARPSMMTKTQKTSREGNCLPLPGKVEDFLGIYSHPGYGTINITLIQGP